MNPSEFSATARRLGVASGLALALLGGLYAITLAAGLLSTPPKQAVGDPFFSILEILIIVMAPLMVALMIALHAWTPPEGKPLTLAALVFMSMLAAITSSVHFVILTVSRQIASAELPWLPVFFSFNWPSVVYAVDIFAWDVLFALSVLCAAPVFKGDRLRSSIRILMIASGLLSIAGLAGVAVGDMPLRLIGVAGYAAVFPVVALLLAVLFLRAKTVRHTPPTMEWFHE